MKRNARRAVLFACLVAGAGFVQSEPAAAENVCAQAWVLGGPRIGPCQPTALNTECFGANQSGTGAEVCIPLV